MPITTVEQLAELQDRIRTAVLNNSSKALKTLTEALPEGRAKFNQVLVLTGRANDVLDHEIGNTLSGDLLAILRNELRKDILVFTDHLTLADFGPKPDVRPELKPGHLLYKVPPVMKLREAYPCIIRIAHQLNQVLQGIEIDDSVGLEEVSLSEVMEIEVIDPSASDNPAFNILLLSDGEQFVDEYSATEWVFNVRPLREGSHSLVLKISVLLNINGKERAKNIVHQRAISVQAEVSVTEAKFVRPQAVEVLSEIEIVPTPSPPPPPPYVPAPVPVKGSPSTPSPSPFPRPTSTRPILNKRKSRRGFLSIAATVLLLVVGALWITSPDSVTPRSNDTPSTGEVKTPTNVVPKDTLKAVAPSLRLRDSL
jgi:hypothetical protein